VCAGRRPAAFRLSAARRHLESQALWRHDSEIHCARRRQVASVIAEIADWAQWSCGGFDDEADMYVSRDTTPANDADLDFIANARQDIPV